MQPTANDIGIWILVASALLSAGSSAAAILSSFRSQRRQVSFAAEYARKEEFDRHVARCETEIARQKEEWGSEVRRVYERLDRVSVQVGSIDTSTDLLNQRMVQIDAKLDRVIEKRGQS